MTKVLTIVDRTDAVKRELGERLETTLDKRALQLQAEVKRELSKPGTGTTYTTKFFTRGRGEGRLVIPYGKRVPHTASAPGNPPAVDTGRLRASIAWQRISKYRRVVGTNVIYAPYLELGTDRIKPRPFLRPAAERFRKTVR